MEVGNDKKVLLKTGVRMSTSIFSLCLILTPETMKMMAIFMILAIVLSAIAIVLRKKLNWTHWVHKELFLLDLLIVIMLAYDFPIRWLSSSKIALVAGVFHFPVPIFLNILVIILSAMSLSVIDMIFWNMNAFIENHANETGQRNVMGYFILLFWGVLQYISIQYSALSSLVSVFSQRIDRFLFNVFIIMAINLIVLLIVQSWKISLSITSILFCVWSVANYYVVLFHGSPLFISELNNTKTALAVATTYTYNISRPVIFAIAVLIVELIYIYKYVRISQIDSLFKRDMRRLFGLGACLGIIYAKMIEQWGITGGWHWKDVVSNSGFMVCVLSDAKMSANPIVEPKGYESEKVEVFRKNQMTDTVSDCLPDIIVILDESFYDLHYATAITTDVDYLDAFYSIPNAVYGHAIAPTIGGGTNNSEFELLFSKSMNLLANGSPFTYLDNEILARSAVQYLNELGYTTTGMHCGGKQNYMRHIAYPAMMFDNIFLGREAFSYVTGNGNRPWLDADNYKDLIDYYETVDDAPQFIYLLTYQNHGGYEQNDDALDTVHVKEDFGDLTDDVNEYLSSMKLSAEAFAELTEYYSQVDRDVIICMVGDHAPSFVSSLPQNAETEINDTSINLRTVPYVMWSNFDADFSAYYEYASMVDLLPMMLNAANVPLSVYYKHILDLHEVLPIRTSDGKSVNRELEVEQYSAEHEYFDFWSSYYYLEYNSLLQGEEYCEELFLPW